MYFFLAAYTVLGAGIKYIDDAFDKKSYSKQIAFIITPLLSILGAYTMMIDPVSATILLAVLGGVLIKGKIDNLAFATGFAIVLMIVIIAGINFLIIPLVMLTAAAVLDEVGNDYIDKKKEQLNPDKISHKFVTYFFLHRWIMKIAILFLVALGIVHIVFFLAMVLFDYAYVAMDSYSKIKQGIISTTLMGKAMYRVACIFK
jgi:hypothetical protein